MNARASGFHFLKILFCCRQMAFAIVGLLMSWCLVGCAERAHRTDSEQTQVHPAALVFEFQRNDALALSPCLT